jgi:protein-L-isoaspartate(D-aspartate) O-methyltransferase
VERLDALVSRARKVFDRLRYHNIISRIDDGTEGWPSEAPFDRIIVTAGGPRIPEPLVAQLADPGRLIMPVGGQEVQELQLVDKRDGDITVRPLNRSASSI